MKKKTTSEFISEALSIHKGKYDYSKSIYIYAKTKIIIICPIHGEFLQIPRKHTAGQGCNLCCGGVLKTQQQFLDECKRIHGERYDYSKTLYINDKSKIIVICNIHGEYEVRPQAHLRGQNCKKCYEIIRSKCLVENNKANVLSRFIKTHGDKFTYNMNNYVGYNSMMEMLCNKHNISFNQSPANHIAGKIGCVLCQKELFSIGENKIYDILTENNISFVKEKRFPDCKNIKHLRFDFYLQEKNICIEYDGRQHFCNSSWGGDEELQKRIINDQIKNQYCKDNNIRLIRIRYDEDPKEILLREGIIT